MEGRLLNVEFEAVTPESWDGQQCCNGSQEGTVYCKVWWNPGKYGLILPQVYEGQKRKSQ